MTYVSLEPFAVRIGRLLCIDGAEQLSDVRLATEVGRGLPVDAADHLFGGVLTTLPKDDIVSESTLRRVRSGSRLLSREHSERLYEVSRVVDAALQAYQNDAAKAQAFLTRRHPLLEGRTPYDLARTSSAGADAVVALIERAIAGVAV